MSQPVPFNIERYHVRRHGRTIVTIAWFLAGVVVGAMARGLG